MRRYGQTSSNNGCFFGCVALFVVFMIILDWYENTMTIEQVVVTIVKVEDRGGRKHKYMVYADSETFGNEDSFWNGKWNSSDMHGRLVAGGKYRLTVSGWRIPLLSWHRNVIRATRLDTED